jgi:hypothetical protein
MDMDMKEMSSEIFKLPSSVEQLGPINNGVLYPNYREVSCQKAVEGTSFPSGQQTFRFNVSGTTWWCPSKTYMTFRCSFTDEDGAILAPGVDIAPQMGVISNLYNSIELRMGGKVVQRITQFMPQIDALLHRTTKSRPWLESIGQASNFWDVSYTRRGDAVKEDPTTPEDGNPFRENAPNQELIWRPCLPLFHTFDGCLPAGDYEIVLNPKSTSDYKQQVFESGTLKAVPGVNCNFDIQRVQLKVATYEGPSVENKQYALSLDHIECQSNKVLSAGLSQQYFAVSSATKALCVAYQDNRLTDATSSASKYTISQANPYDPGNEVSADRRLLANRLSRLYIQYDGIKRPEVDATPECDDLGNPTRRLQVQERYYQSLAETGMLFDPAGAETLNEWQRRGPYYYFNWNRATASGATRVQVNQEFNGGNTTVDNANVLLFSLSETSAVITVRNGEITSVEQIDR